jgi:putative tryptophan/tyrosine transport system substrate-binding protein
MRRREFIGLLSGAVATWPIPLHAQQPRKNYRLAIVAQAGSPDLWTMEGSPFFRIFFEELRRRGYEEGRNLVVDRLSGDGRPERYAQVARDAVDRNPDVILAIRNTMTSLLKEATTLIPIVALVGDPVGYKLAESLARPGGNITGFSMQPEIHGKYLDILRELMKPASKRVGYLATTAGWESLWVLRLKEIASGVGISLVGPPLRGPYTEDEYRRVLTEMIASEPDGIIVETSWENLSHLEVIVETITRARIPVIYPQADYAKRGGLMAYANDRPAIYHGAADYVDRILKGANPAELPFYENLKYYLIINLKTAREIGLTIPEVLFARADEVIE